jgi:uncharacterized protein YegL
MSDRLGGEVGRNPSHLFFVLDVSGSMNKGGRIQALNNAVREVIPHLRDEARTNPHAQLFVRVLTFATEARWELREPTPVEDFRWRGVDAVPQGLTELGLALRELASCMRELAAEARGYPPAIILVTDGHPTHTVGPHFSVGLQELMAESWGRAAVRLAIGVGRDADLHSLRRFIGREDVPLVRADNPAELTEFLVWASRAASRRASMPVVGGDSVLTFTPPEVLTADPIWNR